MSQGIFKILALQANMGKLIGGVGDTILIAFFFKGQQGIMKGQRRRGQFFLSKNSFPFILSLGRIRGFSLINRGYILNRLQGCRGHLLSSPSLIMTIASGLRPKRYSDCIEHLP